MFQFLKRLFGWSEREVQKPALTSSDRPTLYEDSFDADTTRRVKASQSKPDDRRAITRYFELSGVIEHAKQDGDFAKAVAAARESFPLFAALVRQTKRDFGRFDIQTSHAVHTAGALMAVLADTGALQELRTALGNVAELREWISIVDDAEADAESVKAILSAVIAEPGLKQSDLKKLLGSERQIGHLPALLEKAKQLQRVSHGSTYRLYPPDYVFESSASQDSTRPLKQTLGVITASPVARSRSRSASRARLLTIDNLPYIRLPKAPYSWQVRQEAQQLKAPEDAAGTDAEMKIPRSKLPQFTVTGMGWAVLLEEPLPPKERPNTAYRRMFPTSGSTIWLDPSGHREGFPQSPAVAMTIDRSGAMIAERGLAYDIYRADVNANGSGMLFMSSEGMLHSYDDALQAIVTESIAELPEYMAQAQRFDLELRDLRKYVRCVGLSTDRSRLLITIVDEAWCYDINTLRPIWGLRFPTKEGWTEVIAQRSERFGASAEIEAALRLMELSLPVSPEAITRQYKVLALRWHPDRNLQSPDSTRKFQELGAAMELLTGVDLSKLSGRDIERVAYEQILQKHSFVVPNAGVITMTVTMRLGGTLAVDWIYAAGCAYEGYSTFLAGYSGRIIEVDRTGTPLRVYDIGAVPLQIADTPSYLYILTDTRLYILRQDELVAVLDVFEQGKLIPGKDGFGLLLSKQFQWFTPTGQPLGQVTTRDPIRRIHSSPAGLVIETRTRRALVNGAQSWW
jgi:hypothetical protein